MADLICAGFGGQGVLTLGLIVAKTAMENNKNVTWIPSYGSEMRGGTANCSVRVVDGKVHSPFIQQADVVIAMSQPSAERFVKTLAPGGLLLINSSLVEAPKTRQDVHILGIPASELCQTMGYPRGTNIMALGALASSGAILDAATLRKGMLDFFAEKGRSNPKNADSFDLGLQKAETIQ